MAKIVVALGGNALQEAGDNSAEAQMRVARKTAGQLVSLVKEGHSLVIVHGNGPQIGTILQKEANFATKRNPAMPLDSCIAMSQGFMGYWLQLALNNELIREDIKGSAVTLVTEILIDPEDPAFDKPTKPIGNFYTTSEKALLSWPGQDVQVMEDAGRGWRRAIPSPKPVKIIEKTQIKQLMKAGTIVITGGGGGVPVVKQGDGTMRGVEAIIDKDFVAATVANDVNADVLLILTAVNQVMINFGTPQAFPLPRTNTKELQNYVNEGHFPAGSMLPKVEASINFVEGGHNRTALITTPFEALDAINGTAGTKITAP